MTGQLGQVTLDVVEGGALASLVGVLEQIGGQQLGTFDHAHGDDRRPPELSVVVFPATQMSPELLIVVFPARQMSRPRQLHTDRLALAVGEAEDVAGRQLDGLDHAHGTDGRPVTAP
jgi:hypothetical protein